MNKFEKFRNWCDMNLPMIWGTLWVFIITCGSLALAIWTIKMLLKVLGLL